ncbi:MAG: alanine racemase [Candidatus Brocadiales bacterium]|nr:alanine racemase [Candidatus Brocadiales bacterium]
MKLPSKNWVEIDLAAIAHNVRMIRQRVGRGVGIIGVVKSDAYGHGASRVGCLLQSMGVGMLAVAGVEEGIVLRDRGINIPILVLGCIFQEEVEAILRYSLTPNLCDRDVARKLAGSAKLLDKVAKVHVKIDTGLGSLGVHHGEAVRFIRDVANTENLFIEGIFTHFSSSSEIDNNHTYEQLCIFNDIVREIESLGIHVPLKHAANSGAIVGTPKALFNLVRPGMLLYGLRPSYPDVVCGRHSIDIHPAMTLKSSLGFIKNISAGETVSYGRTFKAQRSTKVGILPLGYDNGYIRALSNRGEVIIRNQRAPVIGRVRMNHVQIDVTDVPGVRVGDEVILFGRNSGLSISVEKVAELINTVPYEVVCAAGRSNPRVYINEVARDEYNEDSIRRPAGSIPAYKG